MAWAWIFFPVKACVVMNKLQRTIINDHPSNRIIMAVCPLPHLAISPFADLASGAFPTAFNH
jgi:hypothetical protein